ncbi:MAG: hypothetical protein LBR10_05865 [Prevotellaceae bacterium]|jgi:hypothetical protein|nr:hypothetical protein [Prevotellaceae bacterium]
MTRKTFVAKLHNIENGILGVKNNPEIQAKLSVFGYTPERLQQEQQAVNEVKNPYSKQLSGKDAAQQATVERDKAFDEICNRYSDFRAIARVALYEKPQMPEALGIVKKSEKPRKQEQSEQNDQSEQNE